MAHDIDLNSLKEQLAEKYRGRWHIWLTRPDEHCVSTLMATRIEHLTDDLVRAGLYRTLPWGVRNHSPSLEEQLEQQTEKAIEIGHYPAEVLL